MRLGIGYSSLRVQWEGAVVHLILTGGRSQAMTTALGPSEFVSFLKIADAYQRARNYAHVTLVCVGVT